MLKFGQVQTIQNFISIALSLGYLVPKEFHRAKHLIHGSLFNLKSFDVFAAMLVVVFIDCTHALFAMRVFNLEKIAIS